MAERIYKPFAEFLPNLVEFLPNLVENDSALSTIVKYKNCLLNENF